jgi:hypothetical protein
MSRQFASAAIGTSRKRDTLLVCGRKIDKHQRKSPGTEPRNLLVALRKKGSSKGNDDPDGFGFSLYPGRR